MEVQFTINGKEYKARPDTVPVDTSLNVFLRTHAQLRGTKFMCLEGGCGVCIVTAKGIHPVTKEHKTWAINSCLFPVYSCHGLDIVTVEGVGNKKDGYHPTQTRLAHLNGTQCGYCSPGMVMNMYSLLESKKGQISMEEIENSFGGNICRCTGYRPILDAFKGMAMDADQKLINLCKDIEDLSKTCPKTGNPCAGTCHKKDSKTGIHLEFQEEQKEWHKVYNINEFCDVLIKAGKRPYMLVSGNTAHGVYRRSPNIEVFIDVTGIDELRSHSIGKELTIGGNVSLTETMEILEKAATSKPEFEYCREIIKHIDLIANVPVRNVGSLAGNLSIKNQHEEFPSDVFITFEAAGAKLTIVDEGGKSSVVSTLDFVNLDMNKKLILNFILPPLPMSTFKFRSYKIMPRAQNAHAFVNAAFLVEFNDAKNKIVSARICFGGIDPKFTHATAAEALLIGKDLYTNDTLQAALKSMNSQINPDWILPDASPEFRRTLALGLFYKFVLDTCPDGKLKSEYKSGGQILSRALSSGTQTFDTYKDKWPLTQSVPKIEALIQCSGEAQYANDIPHQPGELWAAFVHATKPHSKVAKIDPSAALKIPGVQAFFSAKDIPGVNTFVSTKMLLIQEIEEIFCSGEILYHSQPVGMIVADTLAIANSAAEMVEIIYENINGNRKLLPTLLDVLGENDVSRIHDMPFGTKATQYGVGATHSVNGRLELGSQYHYTMEAQTCVCIPSDDGMDVYSATQWMDLTQIAIAEALKIPENSVNMIVRRVGGAYGAKISRNGQIACACALACLKLNCPIRFVMTIESNMKAVGKRYACVNDYKVECDDNGKITKMKNTYYEDFGSSMNENIEYHTSMFFKNCYVNSAWDIIAKAVITDAPSTTWCRAPGTTEGIAMIENIMEHIARETGKTPEAVRLANIADSNPLKKIYTDFIKSIEFDNRRKEIDTFNSKNRWRKRGIGMVPMEYELDYFGHMPVLVSIYHMDGTVSVTHGGIEMGQGINTKVAQVVAHTLGIPLDMISIKPSTSISAPNSIVSGGSIASEACAFAAMKACEILNERIKPIRAEMKNAKWADITHACYGKQVDLFAQYLYRGTDLKPYAIYGVSCAETEIDLLTGNLQLRRVDILEDTGESMSPSIDVGQVEGAFVMGLGYWLTEALVYNRESGELLTNRTWTYKPPGVKDIPIDFRVTFLQKSSNKFGVLRSKATGEPALCMSVCIIFALRHALDSARKDAKLNSKEYYHLGAPSTTETVFINSGNTIEQFQLL